MRDRFAVIGVLLAVVMVHAPVRAAVVAETHRLDGAPYYVDIGRSSAAIGRCALVLPVTLDPELTEAFGYTDRAPEFEPLLAALDRRIERKQSCVPGADGVPAAAGAPRVYVGSAESEYAPIDVGDQRVRGDRLASMVLHLKRPTPAWRKETGALLERQGLQYAVVIQLGVSQYMKGYSGLFRKEVVLGTDHREPMKFLTADDRPVEVLHLTGVLVDAQGKVVRAGAEGILLRDTPFAAQVVDVTRLFSPSELERVLKSSRREDLPGAPLNIEVALDTLIEQLTVPR